MKASVLQENLNKNVNLTSRFTSSRAQLPVLGNILLKTSKTKLALLSTNLEISVSTTIGAKIEKEGEIAIPSRIFTELVANLPKDTISLEVDKEQLKVSTTGFSSTVLGMNTSDFPKIPSSIDKAKSLSLDKVAFSSALNKVMYATSIDETRPILTGVLFAFSKEGLTLVATDGFRLSLMKVPNSKLSSTHSFVVPRTVLSEIARLVEGEEVLLEFRAKEKQVVFGVDEVILSSRLLEGEYPEYDKIIPKTSNHKVNVDKEEFLRAVKLASIFARDNANIVKIILLKDSLKVSAESSSAGNQETKVEAKIDGRGGEFEIAFNYKFIEDFLNSASGEDIVMEFSEVDKPGVFLDPSNSNYLHLVMPVKIQS